MDSSMTLEQGCARLQPVGNEADKGSVGLGSRLPDWGKKGWRDQLRRLEALDLPLLAIGAGPDGKAPASLRDGNALSGWQTTTHTVGQIGNACTNVIGCGTRTGKAANGLLVFDIDGATAVSWCLERGCDPALTSTWQIHRNTDESRLKVAFRLTEAQQVQLGQLKTKIETKVAIKDANNKTIEDGEAVELFHQGGSQVIVLGQHRKSKGHYFWPDDMGPEDLAPIPECWWQAAQIIAGDTSTKVKPASKVSKGKWRNLYPCPICGRDNGYCQESTDERAVIRCFNGQTYSPPTGFKPGELHTDTQGTVWAFSKVQQQSDGNEFSIFVAPDPEKAATTRANHPRSGGEIATITGIQAVLDAGGKGWQTEKGEAKRSRMAIGDLSRSLRKALGDRLGFDELALMPAVDGVPLKAWEVSLLHGELSEAGWIIGSEAAEAGLLLAARRNPFHPVRQYLQRIEVNPSVAPFDLDQVAKRFFRATSDLHTAMVRKWLIGAVARAMDPGCQMDYCLVLQSDTQGLGKSTAFRELASPDWFCSTIPEGDKDLSLNIHNTWIFELAELEALTGRKAAGHLKNMLTTTTDLVRVPYGKAPERLKRPSVFCATVNKREFLRDDTGNRRFWVVPIDGIEKLDRVGLAAARDGIWKAAVQAWRCGELPMLPENLADASEQQNDNYQEQDSWLPHLAQYLNRRKQEQQIPVQAGELLDHIGMERERQSPRDARRARELAESLGWRHRQGTTPDKKRVKGLWPPAATQATQATQAATQANASDTNGSGPIATQATQKSPDHSLKAGKQEQQVQLNAKSGDFWVASVAMAPNASDANGSAWVALGLRLGCTATQRQEAEARIRELGQGADLSGWTDDQVAELLVSLEKAAQRRAAAGGIEIPEVA